MRPFLLSVLLIVNFHVIGVNNDASKLTLENTHFKSASGIKVPAEVGTFKVPENRANPNTEEISIHFIRLKSTNPNPSAPIFYLSGGPGASSTWQARDKHYLESWLPYLELGDVVLVDQRGTGAGSERVLYLTNEDIPEDLFIDEKVQNDYFSKMKQDARAALEQRGVDLAGYTTTENAKDLDALRHVLGYNKISLIGFSYGTHLGQAYLKYYGEQVENAVLVGVEGLNHTLKLPYAMDTHFRKIALMANADPKVSKEVPDLMALYEKLIKKLEKEPITLEVNSPLTQKKMKVKIGAYALKMLLIYDIGDASDLPVFPRLLYSIDQGDYSALTWFMQKRIGNVYGIHGMASTMDPASGATASRRQVIKEQKENSLFGELFGYEKDENWSTPDLGDAFRAPLISNVRTLFMSGTLDFNTPPYQAEEVRWGFSNSSHIIVKNAGHEQVLTHPKANEAIIRFLKGENVDEVTLTYPKLEFIPVKGKTGKLSHPAVK
ncbi:MAG: alpha/beta hydrolase [Flammeovirgaceae bacterium]